jgi:hypothetical protein
MSPGFIVLSTTPFSTAQCTENPVQLP